MKAIGVYILKGYFYYCGSTNDLERRLNEHKQGKCKTTRRIGDWKLVRFIPCESLKEAKLLEMKIKKSRNIKRWLRKCNMPL